VPKASALLRHPLAIAGALIATAASVVFIALLIAMLTGLLENPYAGLVVFIAIPALFVLGLLLIPVGVRLDRRTRLAEGDTRDDWPVIDFRNAHVRRTALAITALTAVNVVILLLAGYGSLHYMDSPAFCGQACHKPMHPQFTAWQNASHARIPCATCHISEGAKGFVHAKLSGVRQLVHVVTNSIPEPIPPGTGMPSGAQAVLCLGCHQPERIAGDQIRLIREYADDEANTETLTILQMHTGATSVSGHAIHWHADPKVRVEYVATDERRQTIPFVRVTDASGKVKEYATPEATDQIRSGETRTMDCIDCHNTVGHPIAPTPEKGVDGAIAAGRVSRQLPHVRREAVRLMTAHASDATDAAPAIERELREVYASRRGPNDQQALAQAVGALQALYSTNVFPAMKVKWGTYPNNKGHMTSDGCFRCHDGTHEAKDGSTINADCEYCHKQIERALN
jgi:nitrate/TMAO reductase-like tetraheme cytochrome c subunit